MSSPIPAKTRSRTAMKMRFCLECRNRRDAGHPTTRGRSFPGDREDPDAGTSQHRRVVQIAEGVAAEHCLKTLIVEGNDEGPVALVLRGDHELNAVKAEELPEGLQAADMADPGKQFSTATGCPPDSSVRSEQTRHTSDR